MSVQQFSAIFDGLQEAYGTYRVDKKQANGKNTGKAQIIREPRSAKLLREHLSRKGASWVSYPSPPKTNASGVA